MEALQLAIKRIKQVFGLLIFFISEQIVDISVRTDHVKVLQGLLRSFLGKGLIFLSSCHGEPVAISYSIILLEVWGFISRLFWVARRQTYTIISRLCKAMVFNIHVFGGVFNEKRKKQVE